LVENRALVALERAVEPSECTATPFDAYVGALVDGMTAEQSAFAMAHRGTLSLVPSYDALFFGTETDPDYALASHAGDLRHTFRDLKRFWSDVESDDIQLLAMHGDVLLDADRIAASLSLMVELGVAAPMTAEEIAAEAQTVADFMEMQGDFHQNPLWTLNAFAFTGEGEADQEIAALPDKIVFGDGLIAAHDAIGLGDVGPRVVLAHEFGHHIQYELGTSGTGPADPVEANRRTELMADALATYYAVHKKGLALNRKRAVDALLSFSVGCGARRRSSATKPRALGRDRCGEVRRRSAGHRCRQLNHVPRPRRPAVAHRPRPLGCPPHPIGMLDPGHRRREHACTEPPEGSWRSAPRRSCRWA
jgi:hypothetical protein